MKTLSTAGQDAIDKQYGGEPVRWLEIKWSPTTSSRHADKYIPNWAEGTILTLSPIDQDVNYNGNLVNHQFSVTLDDSDESLKNYMNGHDIHKKTCILYQWFDGMPIGDSFELFRGQIYGPINWSEGDRTLAFNVVSPIYGREVGFSLEEGQFAHVPEQLTGKAWPLCFGNVLHVPCTVGADIATGTVGGIFGLPDTTLPYKKKYVEIQLRNLAHAFGVYRNMEFNCHVATLGADIVEQTVFFPRDDNCQFFLNTSGVSSDRLTSSTVLSYTLPNITLFLQKATDYLVKLKDELAKSPDPTPDMTTVVVSYTLWPNSKNIKTLTITNWPYPITVESGTLANDGVTVEVTKISFDGRVATQTELAEAILVRPNSLRIEYIDLINQEDALKQEVETLATVLEDTYEIYTARKAAYAANPTGETLNELLSIEASRSAKQTAVFEKQQELYRISYDKQKIEVDIDNLTLIFDTIGRVREKQREIIQQFVDLHKQYSKLLSAIDEQNDYLGNKSPIIDSDQFSQGQLDVTINGAQLNGSLAGNIYEALTVASNYVNVKIDPAKTPDLDTFWLLDDDIDLNGLYCRLPDNRIIKITSQTGKQCRFSPVQIGDSTRNRSKEILVNGPNEAAVKKGLADLLSGNESNAELTYLANSYPSDISKASKDRLTTSSGPVRLELIGDVPFVPSNSPLAFSPNVMAYDFLEDGTGKPARFDIKVGGEFARGFSLKDDSATITSKLCKGTSLSPQDILVTGGPLVDGPVNIEIVNPAKAHFEITVYNVKIVYSPTGDWPITKHTTNLIGYHFATGAKEYTAKQRAAKYKTATDASKYGNEIADVQTRIRKLLKALTALGAAPDEETAANTVLVRDALQKANSDYSSLVNSINIPRSVEEEAERIISESEYKNIFQCELLQWLYTRRYIENIGNNLPDPADEYYFTGRDITGIVEAATVIPANWLTWLNALTTERFVQEVEMLPESEPYVANVGDVVRKTGNYQQMHVANQLPSTIKAVYAYKNIKGYKRLVPLPTSYYTKDENLSYGTYLGVPLNLAVVYLKKPLSDYKDEGWQDGIYVSLESSVGPNPVDIIEYIATNYTNLTPDATTFSTVRAQVDNYPTNFALLTKTDSLKLIEDIAFQSRCAVWMDSGTLKINYLPAMQSSVKTITRANILLDSFDLSFTDTDSLVTKSKNTYMTTYSQEKPYTLVLRGNLARYGEQVDTYDYYCLTNRELVNKSATYWLIHKSNTWKKVSFKSTLDLLILEPFDTVTLDLDRDWVTTDPVDCRVESVSYDSAEEEVTVNLWVPVRAGEMAAYPFAYPAAVSVSDIFPLPQDILAGDAGSGFGSTVPTGIQYDPFDTSLLAVRPKDYGSISPSDLNDVPPLSPTDGLAEFTKTEPEIESFTASLQTLKALKFQHVNMEGTAYKPVPPIIPNKQNGLGVHHGKVGALKSQLQSDFIEVEVLLNGVPRTVHAYRARWAIMLKDGQDLEAYDMHPPVRVSEKPSDIRWYRDEGTKVKIHYDTETNRYMFETI